MSELQADPDFLKNEAYSDASRLDTRTAIQARHSTRQPGWFAWTFDHLQQLPTQARLLELGSGAGDLWLENLVRLPHNWQIVVSDLSDGMVSEARRRLAVRPTQFAWAVLDSQQLPFQAAQFEAALAIGLLDHLPDHVQALSEIHRVLKPGGSLAASAGGRTHLQEIEELVRPFLPEASFGGDPSRFGLENGEQLLSPWFGQVTLSRFEDQLVFKHAAPVAAYVLSEAETARQLTGDLCARFIQSLRDILAEQGEIRVRVEKGIFTAVKL